jgi:predicted dehydrogenase
MADGMPWGHLGLYQLGSTRANRLTFNVKIQSFMNTVNAHPPRLALIGVTGYGAIYWQYLRELLVAKSARLVAAVVINPEEAPAALTEMEEHGTRVYRSYAEMVEAEKGNVDLCLIPTGIQWHARMTIAALRAGMNVLVEKPLAGCLADVRAIRQAEKETGHWVAVGFQDLYLDEAAWLKRAICVGAIGDVRRVRMVGLWPRPTSYFNRNGWAGKLHADGAHVLDSPLNNAFAHFVNLSFFLACREPGASTDARPTRASLWRAHAIESFDTGYVRAETEDGVLFEFFVTHACPYPREPEVRIDGTTGYAEWRHDEAAGIFPHGRAPVIRKVANIESARRSMFAAALRRLTDPSVFICTSQIAERHTAFIDELHRVAEIHQISPDKIDWTAAANGAESVPAVRGIFERLERGLEAETLEDGLLPSFSELFASVADGAEDSGFPAKAQ